MCGIAARIDPNEGFASRPMATPHNGGQVAGRQDRRVRDNVYLDGVPVVEDLQRSVHVVSQAAHGSES